MSTRPITRRRIHRVLSRGMPFAISGWLLATCFDAAAVSATSARTNAGVNGSQVPVDQQGSDPRTGEFSSSSAFSGGAGGGSADASAELGVIKVYAAAFSGAGGVIGSAFAEGAYAEDITVSSAGLNGTPGKITVGVTLQGFVDPQGSMGGSVDWSFNGGGFLGSWSALSSPAFPGGFPVDGVSAVAGGPLYYSAIHDLTLSFIVGSAFTVTERLSVSAFKIDCGFNVALCETTGAGSVNIDFGHSSYWNGVSAISLLDDNGNYVPADLSLFTATSSTGVDMMRSFAPLSPVPEPASAVLLLLGLGGLLGWRGLLSSASGRTRSPGADLTWRTAIAAPVAG